MRTPARIGVAGATGAVGREMLAVLEDRPSLVDSLRPMASAREEERTIPFGGADVPVVPLSRESLAGLDLVLFATGAAVALEFAPLAVEQGAVVVDNSRAFRMEPDVPLVVPEVNPRAAGAHRGIVANPNCSTIQMVLALKPLLDEAGIVRVVASTYQSVSGTGLAAIEELRQQSASVLAGEPAVSEVYPSQIAFNCLPHIDDFDEAGNAREETKMTLETRKILESPELPVTVTCVRVPVFRSHAVALNVQTEDPLSPARAREVLRAFPGLAVVDDPESAAYPTQAAAAGSDATFVGRIRADDSVENGLWMWVVADNLRKGAALNAVQIAELLADEVPA
ncbi:MAG: aspartate-semialdehyde dehydrogenase [Candidatus Eisenbacteria bacterium]|nr:aspartate-semialdehyde dehydrogenase [Candidatus Eisenbacteria bacterium]